MSLRLSILIASIIAVLAVINLVADQSEPKSKTTPTAEGDGPRLERLSFADLNKWSSDDLSDVLATLARSCARMTPTKPRAFDRAWVSQHTQWADWQARCADVQKMATTTQHAGLTRLYIEFYFEPVRLSDDGNALATGYNEPLFEGRLEADEQFSTPVLTMPDDLVSIDLGQFASDLAGRQIIAQIDGKNVTPYPDHEAIIANPPSGSDVLGYMDADDLLYMQIQGSGRVRLGDGSEKRIGYAGKNGRRYHAIGRTLIEQGHLKREDVSMQSIMAWLDFANPEDAAAVRYSNPSYVFFRELGEVEDTSLGPLGAQGVQLTAERSLAIDPAFYPYGTLIWVEADASGIVPATNRLFVAQDTGGAIKGAQRADIFFGLGEEAGEKAGQMKASLNLVALLPRAAQK